MVARPDPSASLTADPQAIQEVRFVEVKIGVRDVAREVVLESTDSPDAVATAVNEAIADGSMLRLTDDKGRVVMVPGALIGFVEIGAPESRKVGFGG
jgi:hypothetical protein